VEDLLGTTVFNKYTVFSQFKLNVVEGVNMITDYVTVWLLKF
jgi:hypothetical protein